jgi:hypothetical protein
MTLPRLVYSMAVSYHDGIKDESFHVSEKMDLIRRAIAEHDRKLTALRAHLQAPSDAG